MTAQYKPVERLVSIELRSYILRRIDRLPPCGGRSALYEKLYETAVDMRAAGHVEPYIEKRVGEIADAVASIAHSYVCGGVRA